MTTRKRTAWQQEADRRWPDAMDMVDPAYGDGQYATVAWCSGLTVELWQDHEAAVKALGAINYTACGHDCWRDHELVDLAVPAPARDALHERHRAETRAMHFEGCPVCRYVFSGKAPAAARRRGSWLVTA